MEIKNINPTAKYVADLKNGGHLELELKYIPGAIGAVDLDGGEAVRKSDIIVNFVSSALVGWNLTTPDGVDVPCTTEKIAMCIPQFIGELTKDGDIVGVQVFNFASNSENYLKK